MRMSEKIDRAREYHARWYNPFWSDPEFREELAGLLARAEESGKVSRDLGVVDACRICEEEEGGSCCGQGIEDHYNAVMLFLNLLLGVEIPAIRAFPGSCLFLGPAGCLLKARHILCVNYLCLPLQKRLGEGGLAELQQTTGEEMEAVFRLHERAKRKLAVLESDGGYGTEKG